MNFVYFILKNFFQPMSKKLPIQTQNIIKK